MSIKLAEILPIKNLADYKLHLATWNRTSQPLDVFVRSREDWERWNTWRGKRDEFNRKYIYAIIDFYHEPDTWLFGGIYEVISRGKEKSHSYTVKPVEGSSEFVGRLKIRFKRPSRAKAVKLEKYYKEFVLSKILEKSYSGEKFCGYEKINHPFRTIENIIKTNRLDWKAALANIKGVYLITDSSNGKRYVGSAYGDSGIWSRWDCYITTGHGWNDDLVELIKEKGIDYARNNFTFALLEYRSMITDDKDILDRESYWKEVLLSREKRFGYNKN